MANQRRYAHRPGRVAQTEAFQTADEAWFWYARCQRLRREGARFEAGQSAVERPCDPDDIAAIVLDLVRRRVLAVAHLRVLGTYGLMSRPPDPRDRAEARDAQLWACALDRLVTPLRAKGIVAIPSHHPLSTDRPQMWGGRG